jgi:predicted RNA binding protein YcfA (HicA-like mRNA interferase family)
VIKILEGDGFRARKSKGTDHAYKREIAGTSRTVIVPTHERDIARGTLRSIIRQAGWTVEEFLALVERYR